MLLRGRWLNTKGPLKTPTDHPEIAANKAFEMAQRAWQGGGRGDLVIFGVGGLPQEKNLEIGMEMFQAFWSVSPPLVHHIGARCSTRREFRAAIGALEASGLRGFRSPAPDGSHERVYFPLPGTGVFFELQYFGPDDAKPGGAHVDIITHEDPIALLKPIGKVDEFGEGSEPRCMVVADEESAFFAVMARTVKGGLWVPEGA